MFTLFVPLGLRMRQIKHKNLDSPLSFFQKFKGSPSNYEEYALAMDMKLLGWASAVFGAAGL